MSLIFCALHVMGSDFHVTTNGTSTGAGSISSPLSLARALSAGSPARPGDTVWIHGGNYIGPFESVLAGTPGQPIVVRSFENDRVTLNCQQAAGIVLSVNGSGTHFWGLEIMNSNPDRTLSRGLGVSLNPSLGGVGNKLINCVIHDTGGGVFVSSISTNSEIVGCIIYNNGYQGPDPDRGHGHGIYGQSISDVKTVMDNVIFNQYSIGIHLYTVASRIDHFNIDRNILFSNGSVSREKVQLNALIGGQVVQDISFNRNLLYMSPGAPNAANMQLVWGSTTNGSAVITNNYFVGCGPEIVNWTNMVFTGNNIVSYDKITRFRPIDPKGVYNWDLNTYTTDYPYVVNIVGGPGLTWSQWRSMGMDANSTLKAVNSLVGLDVAIHPNPYEAGRANVSVLNWGLRQSVALNLSNVVPVGASYEIRNAQDYFGAAVISSVYDGLPVTVPLNNPSVAVPIGVTSAPPSSSPLFNVFVVKTLRPPTPGNIRVVAGQ